MHARDTSGSSRAASAGPDSGAARQNFCFLLKGRETHKIKALSNTKPTDQWPFLLAFLCLSTRMVSYPSLTVSCSFEQGHTHTHKPPLLLNPVSIPSWNGNSSKPHSWGWKMLLREPSATSPGMPLSLWWSQPLEDAIFKNKISYKNSFKLL